MVQVHNFLGDVVATTELDILSHHGFIRKGNFCEIFNKSNVMVKINSNSNVVHRNIFELVAQRGQKRTWFGGLRISIIIDHLQSFVSGKRQGRGFFRIFRKHGQTGPKNNLQMFSN